MSHGLLGRTLGGMGTPRPGDRGRIAAFVLGALAPDIDLVLVTRGWDVYLRAHEAGTHTIVASPILALAVAVLVWLFVRTTPMVRLWGAAWAGVVIAHLGFDLVSGSDMRILAPFSSIRFGPHLLAMADLLAVAILVPGTGFAIALRRTRQGRHVATALTVGALVVLLAVKAESQRRATAIATRTIGGDPASTFVSHADAINGSLGCWMFYQRAGAEVRAWRVNAWTDQTVLVFARSSMDGDPAVAASLRAPVVQTLLGIAAVPFVRVERDGDRRTVLWSDLRHCDAAFCGRSFGVRLDAQGRPGTQIIRIGTYEQARGAIRPSDE